MNTKSYSIVAAIIVVIAAAFTYVLLASPNEKQGSTTTKSTVPAPEKVQSTTPEAATPSPAPAATATAGTYVAYSANSIATTKGTKVLFFHAPWCPQCRQLEASIKAGKIPDNVTIMKVDYDSSQDLRKKYGVTIQTTLVRVDDAGELVKKHVTYDDPTLAAITPKILQ